MDLIGSRHRSRSRSHSRSRSRSRSPVERERNHIYSPSHRHQQQRQHYRHHRRESHRDEQSGHRNTYYSEKAEMRLDNRTGDTRSRHYSLPRHSTHQISGSSASSEGLRKLVGVSDVTEVVRLFVDADKAWALLKSDGTFGVVGNAVSGERMNAPLSTASEGAAENDAPVEPTAGAEAETSGSKTGATGSPASGFLFAGFVVGERKILENPFFSETTIRALWQQKHRMDAVFDNKQSKHYYDVRNAVFPQDSSGSKNFRNRAGDKLIEVHDATVECVGDETLGLLAPRMHSMRFLDICGGPGAWSEVLLKRWGSHARGFGMTLREEGTNLAWYEHLLRNTSHWTPLWGEDGTGDLYSPANINHAIETMRQQCSQGDSANAENCHEVDVTTADGIVDVAVADGGIGLSRAPDGSHTEHLQELFSLRLILAEMLLAMRSLKVGANWSCKIFDTFSPWSASIVFMTTLLFEEALIVKPRRSRIVNSERYLVGLRLKHDAHQQGSDTQLLIKHIERLHADWPPPASWTGLVSSRIMEENEPFTTSFVPWTISVAEKQTKALVFIMDEVERRAARADRFYRR